MTSRQRVLKMLNKVVPRRELKYDAIQILTTVDEPKPISKKSVQLEKLGNCFIVLLN